MPDTCIALLRHGETAGGARFRGSIDNPLTPLGWRQMAAAVEGETWTRIVTSPLKRCADFARELAREREIPLECDERLREMHFGAWEGRSAAELMESEGDALSRFWRDPAANTPPGGEPLEAFQARVLAAWSSLRGAPHGSKTLVVSHGGVIRTLLCVLLGHPLHRLLELETEIGHGALHRVRLCHDGASDWLEEG
jgi:alpha-ribazole phosphatase